MQTKQRNIFSTIKTEGSILPPDLLQHVAEGDGNLQGLNPSDYHLDKKEKINEAINRSWNRLIGTWASFKEAIEKLPASDLGTTLTREKWLLALFRELDYGRLVGTKAIEIEGKSYPISHIWNHTPIHLISCKVDLDKRTSGVAGAAQSSPHGLVQELLNRSDEHLWAFLSNGLKLRILRDNVSLTRQAYVEFDLESMMEGEIYSDFSLLWLLCHQSRVESERPEECWLEKWSYTAQEQGTRALDQLRNGVEESIKALGQGFLSYPKNQNLREKLKSGELSVQDYYRQLLRLVYRLLFLFVAEDRGLLLDPNSDVEAQKCYSDFYSTARIRRLAEKKRGGRHSDLFSGLKVVMEKLGSDNGCPELGLPALGGFLFSEEAIVDIEGCDISNHNFLDAIRALTLTTDGHTRRPVDYKNLGSEELGSVYESLLELHPRLNTEAGTFTLETASGHERKTTGSYYTPSSLINCLLDSALDPVLEEACKKEDSEKAILNLKVCDPATGSGHFLIAAAHRMSKRLAAIRTGDAEPSPEATRTALRDVIGHCIYGVDINPMAVELCKVSLWMEALEPGKPLSFLDHHIKCGNSLLGTTPKLLSQGIPDDAFKPIEGDDKAICAKYKKQNKKERETAQQSLFDQAGEAWSDLIKLGNLAQTVAKLDEMKEDSIQDIHKKQELYEKTVKSSSYLFGKFLTDAWCASFVWKKTKELPYPITEEVFRKIEKNPHSAPSWMKDEVICLANQYKFFHWHLAFPDVFRIPSGGEEAEDEQAGWSGGFDVVLGNPPWERIKLQEKEWFASRQPGIANASNAATRRRMIVALKEKDSAMYKEFQEARRQSEGESHLIRSSGRFPLCGRGDVNTYAVFTETNRSIICLTGRVGCVVPSGIATDDSNKGFIEALIRAKSLASFYDFTNRGYIFLGTESTISFSLLTFSGTTNSRILSAAQLWKVDDLKGPGRVYSLDWNEIHRINPNTLNLPIFRSARDADLVKRIQDRARVLIREGAPEDNPWGIHFLCMFHMTNDSHLFRTREQLEADGWTLTNSIFNRDEMEYLPLYEAKLASSFNHRSATFAGISVEQRYGTRAPTLEVTPQQLKDPEWTFLPRYWVSMEHVEAVIPDYWSHNWLIGFRNAISAVADARSVKFTVINRIGVGNSFPLIFPRCKASLTCALVANCNAFILDYVTKQKASGGNLNFYIVKQLPILSSEAYGKDNLAFIIPRFLELAYTSWDLKPFAKDCHYDGPPFQWDEERRFLLRCELDAAFFHLYLGEQEKWQRESQELRDYFPTPRDAVDYIMDTFPIVKRKDEQKYGEYRTKRVILEIYDEMTEAIRTGKPYQTRLDPPPAHPSLTHPPKDKDVKSKALDADTSPSIPTEPTKDDKTARSQD